MQNEEQEYADDFAPIPPLFYSDLTKAPFSECTMCSKSILEEGVAYVIEKAFRYNPEFKVKETVFEYAICWECAETMKGAMSKESMQNLSDYFMKNSHLLGRRHQLLQSSSSPNIERWLDKCIIKQTPIHEMTEYQVFGQFDGEHILYHETPYLIGGAALEEMSELLSKQTKDEMDGFIEDNTGLPPELKKALLDSNLVFL